MTAIRQYNIVWYPSFFVSDVYIRKHDGDHTIYYIACMIFFFLWIYALLPKNYEYLTIFYTKNDGYQTILYSLISVIFFENMHHLQKLADTKAIYYNLINITFYEYIQAETLEIYLHGLYVQVSSNRVTRLKIQVSATWWLEPLSTQSGRYSLNFNKLCL